MTAKLYADRGYISQELKSTLRVQGARVCPHLALQQINMQAIRIIDL